MRQAERAIFDLRRGLPVLLRNADGDTLILPVESLDDAALADLCALAGNTPVLLLTRHRLASLDLPIGGDAAALALDPLPKAIWMQLGVRNDEAARKAEARDVKVVMNRCPAIEWQRLLA